MGNNSEIIRKSYIEKKEKILALLKKTELFYADNEDEGKVEVFQSLQKNLEDGEFSIVVVGEFSAGKSTLLNALMGQKILPSFSGETTATVNFLRHKDRATQGERGKIYYKDGQTRELQDVSLDIINKYVSTKGDDVAKTIEHLDLYLDSKFLEDGVTLVDSPGLNGIAEGHKEITEQQILKSNASIFVFNSDHPGSKTDFEFLYELQKKVKTIIFVLNKIDTIKEEEGNTVEVVVDSLKKNYKKQFPEAETIPEIWPVAAFPALMARSGEGEGQEYDSRLQPFEERLLKFLTCGEKAHQQLVSPIERVLSVVKESKDIYEEDIEALNNKQDSVELENKIGELQEVIKGLVDEEKENKRDISRKVKAAFKNLNEGLIEEIEKEQEKKLRKIDRYDELEEIVRYLKSFEEEFLRSVKRIISNKEDDLQDHIRTIIEINYNEVAEAINERLMQSDAGINIDIKNHLDINVDAESYKVGLKEMGEKSRKLEQELRELEEKADEAEEDFIKARDNEKRKKELQEQLIALEKTQDTINRRIMPEVDRWEVTQADTEERGGILGGFLDIVIGEKKVNRQVMKEDRSNRDRAEKQREEELAKNKREIKKTEEMLAGYNEDSVDLKQKRFEKMKKQIAKKMEELEKNTKNDIEKIDASYKKQIQDCKYALRDFCDDVTDELKSIIKKETRKEQEVYVNIVMGVVEANLQNEIKQKEDRIRNLQKQMESSENDKKQQLEKLNEKILVMNDILSEGIDIQAELESEEIDTIAQQDL
nr:dynamin family protein [uncultured Anaerobutyricum sp.]